MNIIKQRPESAKKLDAGMLKHGDTNSNNLFWGSERVWNVEMLYQMVNFWPKEDGRNEN